MQIGSRFYSVSPKSSFTEVPDSFKFSAFLVVILLRAVYVFNILIGCSSMQFDISIRIILMIFLSYTSLPVVQVACRRFRHEIVLHNSCETFVLLI